MTCVHQTSSESRRGRRPRPTKTLKSLVQVYRLFRFHPQGVRPRFPHTAPNDVCRVPETPNGRLGTRATIYLPHHSPPLGSALRTASNTYPTNTRNYLQLLDGGLGWLRSRAGSYFRAQCMVVAVSWITNTELSSWGRLQ